ncbi:MAG: RibD family protein, partial [Roseiflexaceae bacterium]|nr:RibD family protein [Roseiflexaceae bacterium]
MLDILSSYHLVLRSSCHLVLRSSCHMNITLCYTQTLDGRLATANGSSQWIGGGASVAYWHQLRAEHDAVVVGIGTLLADNPRLTVRHVPGRDPLRVIVDSRL